MHYQLLNRNVALSPLGGIRLAALVRNGMGVPVPRRILNCYSVVYVFGGSGTYRDDDTPETPINAGDVIQLMPSTAHWYGPDSSRGWDEVFIMFEGPAFELMESAGCMQLNAPVTTCKPLDHWRQRFVAAAAHSTTDGSYSAIGEVLRVQRLLLDLMVATQENHEDDNAWLDEARLALKNTDSGREAAKQLGTGYESFRKRFRKLSGMAPGRYRAHVTMEQACDLLTGHEHTVREIARMLDYCDEFHFSKQFNKIIGCSPSAYRARAYRR